MSKTNDFFISIDVETTGPNPGDYALLSIGACTLTDPLETFYIELIPTSFNALQSALEISNLNLEQLAKTGIPVKEALQKFSQWIEQVLPESKAPVFTAFNAPFDWMFVNDYFHRYLGYNPFGHKALDIKALYMGAYQKSWNDTSFEKVQKELGIQSPLTHHALEDAIQQADILKIILKELEGA